MIVIGLLRKLKKNTFQYLETYKQMQQLDIHDCANWVFSQKKKLL